MPKWVRRLTDPRTLWLAALLLALTDLAGGLWAVRHLQVRWQELAQMRKAAASLAAIPRQDPSVSSDRLAGAQRELDATLAALPAALSPLDLARTVTAGAGRHHLTVVGLSFGQPQKGGDGLTDWPVTVTVTAGDPADLVSFAADLEAGSPPAVVPLTQVAFQPGQQVALNVHVYGRFAP